jgi:hypothetical protein
LRHLCLVTVGYFALLAGCDTVQPERVCAADETVSTVRGLLLTHLLGDPTGIDQGLVRRAFDDTVSITLIRYEGQDKETKTIKCRASVESFNVNDRPEITYARRPNIGEGGFVYEINVDDSYRWNAVARDIADRYRVLERAPLANPGREAHDHDAPSSPATSTSRPPLEAPQGSTSMHHTMDEHGRWPSDPDFGKPLPAEQPVGRAEYTGPPTLSRPDRPPEPSSATSTEPSEQSSSSLPTSGRFRLPVEAADDGSAPTSDDRVTSTN